MKKYVRIYLETLLSPPCGILVVLWVIMTLCGILSKFTSVVMYEGGLVEYGLVSVCLIIPTIIGAVTDYRCEQKEMKQEELTMESVTNETSRIKNGDIVQHFKRETVNNGDPNAYLYKVIDVNAREVDNYERVVVYESLYSNGGIVGHGNMFVRKYDEFMSEVDHEKYPNIKQKYRFEVV